MNEPARQRQPTAPLVAITGNLLLGGSSTFLLNLSRAFARRGYGLPVVALSGEEEYAADFAATGSQVHRVPGAKLIYEDRLREGYREVSRYTPRAVLSCLGAESFEVLRLLPPGVGRFGIIQSHDPGPYQTARTYAPYLDVIVGVSREIEKELRSLPELKRVRVEYIPYGIEFSDPVPLRSFDAAPPLRIIYLGRLAEEQKRVSRLVELARQLDAGGAAVEFTFAGAGPREESLHRELAGVKSVRFTGPVPYDRTRDLLALQDVFILLSDYEGLPLSLLEAMGYGVVPVVSDLPSGMREVVRDELGFRVPVGDVQRAFEVITALARDRSQLRAKSDLAAAFVREHYSADRMAGRYVELIETLGRKVAWPERPRIPAPLGLQPWLYSGVMRHIRRYLKPLLGEAWKRRT